jgi:hypothetical protein
MNGRRRWPGTRNIQSNSTRNIKETNNKISSDYQPCQLVKITDVSGITSVPIIRAMMVPESSAIFNKFTRLKDREDFIIVSLRESFTSYREVLARC